MNTTTEKLPGQIDGPFQCGQALWTCVNGEPALRYYLRREGYGHVLAFKLGDESGHYFDFPLFWSSEAGVLLWMIDGIEKGMAHSLEKLGKRCARLAEIAAA